MSDSVETLLRNTMAHRGDDVAGLGLSGQDILRRGKRAHKARLYSTMASVVVLVVALLGGAVAVTSYVHRDTMIVPARNPLPADAKAVAILKGTLFLPGGVQVTLPALQGDESIWWQVVPVNGGWFAMTTNRILFVDPAGKTSLFASSPTGPGWDSNSGRRASGPDGTFLYGVVSPDGRKVAISYDDGKGNGAVKVFDVATRQQTASTPVHVPLVKEDGYDPADKGGDYRSYVFAWYKESVILGAAPYKGLPRVGLWDPKSGPWNGSMTTQHIGIVEGVAGGGRLLGYTWQKDNGTACVGFVDPTHGFVMSNTVCIPRVVTGSDVAPSAYLAPGGKHVLVRGITESKLSVVAIEGNHLRLTKTLNLPAKFEVMQSMWEDATNVLVLGNPPPDAKDVMWRCSAETGQCVSLHVSVPANADMGQFTAAPLEPQAVG